MKKIFTFVLMMLPFGAMADAINFESKYGMVCQPEKVFEQLGDDCSDVAILDAMNSIDLEASSEELQGQFQNLGMVVQNNQFLCKISTMEISVDNFPKSKVAIYKDSSTGKLKGVGVVQKKDAVEMKMTLSGFASGLPLESTLKVSTIPNTENGNIYKAWKTDEKGDVEVQTCVVYEQL